MDRAAGKGDFVVMDYTGSIAGEEFEGGAGRGLEQAVGHLLQPGRGILQPLAGLPDDRGAPPLGAPEHLVEQVLLPAEVAVDRAFGHAGARGDGRGGGGPESDGGVQLECCSKQPLAGGLTVAA